MKVFYRPELTAPSLDTASPSARKPALVIHDWLAHRLITPTDIESFEPVSADDFKRVHASGFVDGILDLRRPNGYENVDPALVATLPYTSGSMVAAAVYAVTHRTHACSPTSGFHHAFYDFCGGFCTFNGLVIAAIKLKQAGLVDRVGILDLDMHYGDGTDHLIQRHGLHWIQHRTQGRHFHKRADVGLGARRYFDWLNTALQDLNNVDLVICQASADPHIKDPLGGLLTEAELQRRDTQVFRHFAKRALVWNLAGGYQIDPDGGLRTVLRLHRQTAKACVQAGTAPRSHP